MSTAVSDKNVNGSTMKRCVSAAKNLAVQRILPRAWPMGNRSVHRTIWHFVLNVRWPPGNASTSSPPCTKNTTANAKVSTKLIGARQYDEHLSHSCVEDCRSVKCPEDTACLLVKNTGEPFCFPKKHCDSTANPEPVCGTNGVNYPNICAMRLSADAPGRTPELAHKGHCGKYWSLVYSSFSFALHQSFPRNKVSGEFVSALWTLCLLSSISAGLHRLSIFSSILRAQRRMQYEYCCLWWRWLFIQELLCLITWPVWQESLY